MLTTVPPTGATTTTSSTAAPSTTTTTVRPAPTTKVPTTVAKPTTTTTRVTTTTQPAPAGNSGADALALLNRDRTSRGLPALKVRADAQAKAQAWAERLARENALYHSTMTDGLASCATAIGENVASAPSVAHAETALMGDPPHRENILATRWTSVGVGVAKSAAGYVVVQVFIGGC